MHPLSPTIDGTTPLMIACKNGYLDLVNFLLKQKKISVGQRDNNGNTSLPIAAQVNHDDIVFVLMDAGSNICHCKNHVVKWLFKVK